LTTRCPTADRRAYLADVHCQRCGTAIVPPPPAWLRRLGRVFWALIVVAFAFQVYAFGGAVLRTEHGRAAFTTLIRLGRYAIANGGDIAGLLLAFVVAPLVGLYFMLRALVDVGDWLDLKGHQWRAERFRKYGW